MAGDLPTALESFVLSNLRSLEHLDALLALYREPSRWWTGRTVSQAIGTSVPTADQILEDLCSANLLGVRVSSSIAYQFNPGSPEIQRLVTEFIEALRGGRQKISTLITDRRSFHTR